MEKCLENKLLRYADVKKKLSDVALAIILSIILRLLLKAQNLMFRFIARVTSMRLLPPFRLCKKYLMYKCKIWEKEG